MCRLKDLVEKISPTTIFSFFFVATIFCCHNMGLISTTQNLVDNNTVPIQWITSRNSIQCRFFPTLFISGLCWRFCIGPSTTSPPLAQVDPAHPGPDRAQAQRMRLNGQSAAEKLTEKSWRKVGVPPSPLTESFRAWGFWTLSLSCISLLQTVDQRVGF